MLLVGYCYGIRHEGRLCQEVALHLAYRWFCKLDLDDKVPHHSTFSVNRLGRFRESDILRHIFERVVARCMTAGLVKGDGFAVRKSDDLKRAIAAYKGWPRAEIRSGAVRVFQQALEIIASYAWSVSTSKTTTETTAARWPGPIRR